MAIGIWGKPAQLDIQPYDKKFMLRAADAVQKRADKTEADYDALLGDFNKIPALAKDADKRNAIVKSYKQQLSQAYDSAKGDVTKLVPVIKNLSRDFRENLSYGPLSAIAGNYGARKEHEAQVQSAYEKGFINQQRRDALLDADMQDYQGIGDGDTYGKFNSYKGSTPAKEVDLVDKAVKFANNWKADKIARGGYGQDKNGLFFINYKNEKEYVKESEVYNAISSAFNQDPEIKSFIDQETRLNTRGINDDSEILGTDHNGNPVQINPRDYVNNYRNQFIDKAARFAASKEGFMKDEETQSDLSANPYTIEKFKDDLKNQGSKDVTTSTSNIISNPVDTTSEDAILNNKERYFNPDGSLRKVPESRAPNITIELADGRKVPVGSVVDNKKLAEITQTIKNIKTKYPDIFKDESDEVILTKWREAKQDVSKQVKVQINPSNSILSNLTEKLFGKDGYGDLGARGVYISNLKGNTAGDLASAAKALGYDSDIPIEARKQAKVIGILPFGVNAGDMIVSIPDSKGRETKMLVENDKQIKDIFRTSSEAINAISTLSEKSYHDDFSGLDVKVEPVLDPTSKKFVPKITLTDPETGKSEQISLSALIESEKEQLINSGYLYTNLNEKPKE